MSFADAYEANPQWQPWSREQALAQAIERLPASARAKYSGFVAAVTDAEALMAAALMRSRDLEDRFQMALDRADRAERAAAQGIIDQPALAKARESADVVRRAQRREILLTPLSFHALAREWSALEIERNKRRGAHGQASQLVVRLDAFLLSGVPPCRPITAQARPQEGESLPKAVERVRAAISIAQREVGRVRSAPLPAEMLAESIRDQVRELARSGTPVVTIGAGEPPRIEWSDGPQLGGGIAALGATRLLAALFPKQMEEMLLAGIDRIQGIAPPERDERLERLGGDIRQLEHEEESLISQALTKGLDGVDRRGDAGGFALLQIEPIPLSDLVATAAE
jgi:hypothetical protein